MIELADIKGMDSWSTYHAPLKPLLDKVTPRWDLAQGIILCWEIVLFPLLGVLLLPLFPLLLGAIKLSASRNQQRVCAKDVRKIFFWWIV